MSQTTTSFITTSLLYTSLVFSAGFLCGVIRVPFIQPYLGDRGAQLLEMPIMFLAIWKSARFIVERLRATTAPTLLLGKKGCGKGVMHVKGKGKEKGKIVVRRKTGKEKEKEDNAKVVEMMDNREREAPSWAYWILGAFSFVQILGLEVGWYILLHWEEEKGVSDWIKGKDPIAGTAFLGMLVLFAVLPGLTGGAKGGDLKVEKVEAESDDGWEGEDPIIWS
jgi:hypothetical protein